MTAKLHQPTSLVMHRDRLLPADPAVRDIARRLYNAVRDLPIISPHGHVNPRILLDNVPFRDPAELFVTPDHYVTRLLHASATTIAVIAQLCSSPLVHHVVGLVLAGLLDPGDKLGRAHKPQCDDQDDHHGEGVDHCHGRDELAGLAAPGCGHRAVDRHYEGVRRRA